MKPTVGRIVHYTLNESDVAEILRRRTTGENIAARITEDKWPLGAQAHIGNSVTVGDVLPMLIVKVWGDSEQSSVNGRVFLDGSDEFWACSKTQVDAASTDKQGHWNWPPRE